MKTLYGILLFLLIGCGDYKSAINQQNTDTENTNNIYESYKSLIKLDSLKMAKRNIEMGVVFNSIELCDDLHGIFLDQKKIEKFGTNSAYKVNKSIVKDSIIYTFEIISECCYNFLGGIELNNDTLYLNYIKYNFPCDCFCDYKLSYCFKSDNRSWKTVITREIIR